MEGPFVQKWSWLPNDARWPVQQSAGTGIVALEREHERSGGVAHGIPGGQVSCCPQECMLGWRLVRNDESLVREEDLSDESSP